MQNYIIQVNAALTYTDDFAGTLREAITYAREEYAGQTLHQRRNPNEGYQEYPIESIGIWVEGEESIGVDPEWSWHN